MGLSNFAKAAIATAIGGPILGANVYAAGEDKAAQDAANQQNIASAKEQQNFQERMANTSYQRAMKDMEAANLNPMLAFSQGGASVPSGAAATVAPSSTGYGRAASKSMSEALNAATSIGGLSNQTAQTQSTVGLQSAQAAQSNASAQQAQASIKKMQIDQIKTEAETKKTLQEAKQSAETFQDRKELLKTEIKMRQVDQEWQVPEKYINSGAKVTGAIGDLTGGLFKGLLNKIRGGGNSGARPPSNPPSRATGRTESMYNSQGEHTGTKEIKWNFPTY